MEIVDGDAHQESGDDDFGGCEKVDAVFEVAVCNCGGQDENEKFGEDGGDGCSAEAEMRDDQDVADEVKEDTGCVYVEDS